MNVSAISGRDELLLQPGQSQISDPTDPARIFATGISKLGHMANWLGPSIGFNSASDLGQIDLVYMAPQPRHRDNAIEGLLRANPGVWRAISVSVGHVDLLEGWLSAGLVDFVHLSIDRLQAATGDYDVERGLRKLSGLAPNAVIVATSAQMAIAAADGQIVREQAFQMNLAVCGEGKGAAFFCAFVATFLETKEILRALVAGHANGASAARSFEPLSALLNRQQLEEFSHGVDSRVARPVAGSTMRIAIAGAGVATLLGAGLLRAVDFLCRLNRSSRLYISKVLLLGSKRVF